MPEKIVNDTLRGIGLMTLAMAAFAGADSAIKLVSASLPAGQILAALGAGGALLFAAFLRGRGHRLITPYWIHPGVLGRNIAEIIGTIGIVSALGLIPLSQVSAIMQGGVLVVTLGAALFLGERVGPRRWAVVFIGLAGVLIIVAPAPGAPFTAGTLMAVVGMVGLSLRDLFTRLVPKDADNADLSFLTMLATALSGLLLSAFQQLPWPGPALRETGILIVMVLLAGLACFCVTAAMRLGDVSAVAPFRYTRVIFAFVLAVVIFDETLAPRTLFGTALIVAAGLYTLLREQQLAQARTAQSGSENRP